jgi:hypothetical protein
MLVCTGGVAATQSLDGDSLPVFEEFIIGTTVGDADSDGDGLLDGREARGGTNPVHPDTDRDGVHDGAEIENGTDPNKKDTDGDGLSDHEELKPAKQRTIHSDSIDDGNTQLERVNGKTDPLISDTDKDGLSDGREVNTIGSSPVITDTDKDGLPDGVEVNKHRTDPTDADTDNDSLADGREIVAVGTDPRDADTDDDLAMDGMELNAETDPTSPDTDQDGFLDGVELSNHEHMADADPLRKDVFIEVDYADESLRPDDGSYTRLVNAFNDAPVSNPNGENRIAVHVIEASEPATGVDETLNMYEYVNRVYRDESVRETAGEGVFHVMVVEDVKHGSDDVSGVTSMDANGMLVEKHDRDITGSILMHELGHNLGLWETVYPGIDSNEKTWDEYPSVMNYNYPRYVPYEFSPGPGHDDWEYIEEHMEEELPNTTKLREEIS